MIRTKLEVLEENKLLSKFDPHYLIRTWRLFFEIRTKLEELRYIPVDLAHEDVDEFDGKGFQQVEIVVCCVGDINYKHNVRSENCFCDLQDARIEVMYLRHLIFLFFFFLFSVVCVFWNEEIHKILISNKTKPDVPLLQILPGVLP